MKRTTFALAAAIAASTFGAQAAPVDFGAQATPVPPNTTVVLVHGAFADGSSWDKVIPLLQAKGLKVVSVQNPLTSLADDVAATQRVIDAQTGKVVLVAHSWGGTVITQAGSSDKIKALVYVAAFAPSEGEVTGALGKDYPVPPGIASMQADASGYLWLPADSVAKNFAPDVSPERAALLAATQGPINSHAFGEPTTYAAWKTKPTYYIVSAKDRMIAPDLEQAFAMKMKATTITLQASHVSMISHANKVADVIIAAARR